MIALELTKSQYRHLLAVLTRFEELNQADFKRLNPHGEYHICSACMELRRKIHWAANARETCNHCGMNYE
jgi:hypothetical protein